MKVIENKALWLPRVILIIAYAIIGYTAMVFSVKSPDLFTWLVVITLFLTLTLLFALTFYQPLYSIFSHLILFTVLYFLLRSGFSEHMKLMIANVNLFPIAVWMLLAATFFLILSTLFPHMLDRIEITKW